MEPRAAVVAQTYELTALDRLEPHPENPRKGDTATIGESLSENGFYGALVAQKSTGYVLVGNHRLLSSREAGIAELPVIWVDVDDERALRILTVDNRSSDKAGYNVDALGRLISRLADSEAGLRGTGFTDADLADMLAKQAAPESRTDPDDVPVRPKAARSKLGDVWLLGSHRLACGDSRDLDVVGRALGGRQADMAFTDPPYGVAYEGKTKDKLTVANDSLAAAELEELLVAAFLAMRQALVPGGPFYVCSPPGMLELTFRHSLAAAELQLRQQIVWVKNTFVLGHQDYHQQHESMLYGWALEGEPPMPPHYDAEHDTLLYGWRDGARHVFEGGRKQSTVWTYDKPSRSSEHPTMKPVALVERAIRNSTKAGGVVLDLFAGSGSTVIAAHLSARNAAVVELEPKYCDVICRRYQEHTGVVPVLERTGEPVDFTPAAP